LLFTAAVLIAHRKFSIHHWLEKKPGSHRTWAEGCGLEKGCYMGLIVKGIQMIQMSSNGRISNYII
jgi:hypothetical protein